jgi:hypothetical protein
MQAIRPGPPDGVGMISGACFTGFRKSSAPERTALPNAMTCSARESFMRIELQVELSETMVSDHKTETRRFSRDVEMPLPEVGQEIELNVAAEPVLATVKSIRRGAGHDDVWHVAVSSSSLTFKSLREDERWNETLL